MAAVSKEIVFDRPAEQVFAVLIDYARYPEFVPGIKGCCVLPGKGDRQVEYELDLGVKRVKYVLRHVETPPTRITWSLVSGDLMKVSDGEWALTPDGGSTRARYTVDIQISKPPLIPQSVIDKVSDELTRVQLPRTLEAFKARVERAGR
ncbi:MAG: SRPBCC family protein [Anaeromyxobacteraceae bacterium]|nr:SRPBCC family protein [Anaeromyxobacteraceae bacterium]